MPSAASNEPARRAYDVLYANSPGVEPWEHAPEGDRKAWRKAVVAAVSDDSRFPNGWPRPSFLHVAGSDGTNCDLHLEWPGFELYVSREGSFHFLSESDDVEGPDALIKLREALSAVAE
jgi:hypothetical protein